MKENHKVVEIKQIWVVIIYNASDAFRHNNNPQPPTLATLTDATINILIYYTHQDFRFANKHAYITWHMITAPMSSVKLTVGKV